MHKQINTLGKEAHVFDAIVIGSGMSGGWAAKELCEKGLKTLVLERGRHVEHIKDYTTAGMDPWDFEFRNGKSRKYREENPIVSQTYCATEDAQHFFVKDDYHPYIQEKPFTWIRGYQTGGRSLMWGRAAARWSEYDFSAPARFGYGGDWPIRYKDIAPWYSHVEKFMGVSGSKENIDTMPDGEFLKPYEMNCLELKFKEVAEKKFNRHFVMGRWANLTDPQEVHLKQGRTKCMGRDRCSRGCPLGGYFSANSGTLPWARNTGNMTLRPETVVHSIIYDEQKQKAVGVRVLDAHTHEATEYFAPVIFCNASTLNTNLILLNSVSNRFPNGLGNDNGLMGKYIAFHNYRAGVGARSEEFKDKYVKGRRQAGCIIPNFRNVQKQDVDFLGGYVMFVNAYRPYMQDDDAATSAGADFKERMSRPGSWEIYTYMQGEVIPIEANHVRLSKDKKDPWGIPQIIASVGYTENDFKLTDDFIAQAKAMFEAAGMTVTKTDRLPFQPGLDIHEMGGVRMGRDPKTSLLNEWNQLHHVKNVFVTDGACMPSAGNQSPSILYMALTARAANYAAEEFRKGNLS